MDKREMSPFGRLLFETFGAITKAQSELIRAQNELSNFVVADNERMRGPRISHNAEMFRKAEEVAETLRNRGSENEDWEVRETAK